MRDTLAPLRRRELRLDTSGSDRGGCAGLGAFLVRRALAYAAR